MQLQTKTKMTVFHCDQCNQLTINGVMTHESGCPNETRFFSDESLDIIVEVLKGQEKWIEEYYTENTDHPIADYVGSFGYGSELDHEIEYAIDHPKRFFDDEITEVLEALDGKVSKKTIIQLIKDSCGEPFYSGMWTNRNEVISVSIGEVEDEIHLDNHPYLEGFDLTRLGDDDWDYIKSAGSFCIHDGYMYVSFGCNRWVMAVDEDEFFRIVKNTEELYNAAREVLDEEYADQVRFDAWMIKVDKSIAEYADGLTSTCFSDYRWRDLFSEGFEPSEAVTEFAEDNHLFGQYFTLSGGGDDD